MVVLPDADVDAAADAAISAAYGSAGERCMAISVVVAVGAVADPLVDAIVAPDPRGRGGPRRPGRVDDGPAHHQRPSRPRALLRGRRGRRGRDRSWSTARAPTVDDGFFVGCSLLDDVEPGMTVYDDEIFGPVLSVVRVASFDDALALGERQPVRQRGRAVHPRRRRGPALRARGRPWGWSASTCRSRCRSRGTRSAGWKASLFGDAPVYGPEGIRFYTRPKVVTSRWPDPASSVIDLGFPTNH